jgi:hypothetical protein
MPHCHQWVSVSGRPRRYAAFVRTGRSSLRHRSSSGRHRSHPLCFLRRSLLQHHRVSPLKHRRASIASISPLLLRAHALSVVATAAGALCQPASPRRALPLEACRSTAPRLPRELVRTDAILAGQSRRCRSPLPLCRSSMPPSHRRSDTMPGCSSALGGRGLRPVLRQWAARVLCHWVASRIRSIGLCFVFLFFEYVQIIESSKICTSLI